MMRKGFRLMRSVYAHLSLEASVTLSIKEAAHRLQQGGIILYPTETFFGIGCRADMPSAILRVFQAKQRAHTLPLPVILGNMDQLPLVAAPGASLKQDLKELSALWPAPLTLLLPARRELPALLTGGSGRIAVRISAHSTARALALSCGMPIVSSSANISGQPAVCRAEELSPQLTAHLDAERDGIVTAGDFPAGGQPSTIAEPLGQHRLRLLRQGAMPAFWLERAGFTLIARD
jgi:L-threonylcarbamoyladenylate synthase